MRNPESYAPSFDANWLIPINSEPRKSREQAKRRNIKPQAQKKIRLRNEAKPDLISLFLNLLVAVCEFVVRTKHIGDFVLVKFNHIFASLTTILARIEIFGVKSESFTYTGSKCKARV